MFNFVFMFENEPQEITYSEKQVSILLATEQLIAEKGYSATSVRDIAHAAAVNVAMISYYFGSKEKLLEALFVYRIGASRVLLQSLLENTQLDPFQKLEVLTNSYVERWAKNLSFFQIMSSEPAIREIKEISTIVNSSKQRNIMMVARLIEEGQDKGFFKANVDVHLLMHTVVGTLNSVFTSCDTLKTIYRNDDISAEEFLKILQDKLKRHLFHTIKSALSQPE